MGRRNRGQRLLLLLAFRFFAFSGGLPAVEKVCLFAHQVAQAGVRLGIAVVIGQLIIHNGFVDGPLIGGIAAVHVFVDLPQLIGGGIIFPVRQLPIHIDGRIPVFLDPAARHRFRIKPCQFKHGIIVIPCTAGHEILRRFFRSRIDAQALLIQPAQQHIAAGVPGLFGFFQLILCLSVLSQRHQQTAGCRIPGRDSLFPGIVVHGLCQIQIRRCILLRRTAQIHAFSSRQFTARRPGLELHRTGKQITAADAQRQYQQNRRQYHPALPGRGFFLAAFRFFFL